MPVRERKKVQEVLRRLKPSQPLSLTLPPVDSPRIVPPQANLTNLKKPAREDRIDRGGLHWFHITMRMTVMKQMAKGLVRDERPPMEAEARAPQGKSIEEALQSLKWNLWHGNVERALERIEELRWDLDLTPGKSENRDKLSKQLAEFDGYIQNNRDYIPNYGERYRNGERISTAFAESTVNQVVSKRMVKKQQMAWTERGAHLLLQVRTRVLNGELEETFRRWYPQFRPEAPVELRAAA
jgi:hypothetical protein